MIYKVINSSDLKLIGFITKVHINIHKVILLQDGARTYKFDIVHMKGRYGEEKLEIKNSNNTITLMKLEKS